MNPAAAWAIVPVKPLSLSKSRLTGVLDAPARAALTRRLLTHVLKTLQQSPGLTRCLVVSRDPEILALAQEYQAVAFLEEGPLGLNRALMAAAQFACAADAVNLLITPSDLPFVGVEDIAALLAASARLAICPDRRQQGTNALLVRGLGDFRFRFGLGSFRRHLQEANRLGWTTQIIRTAGFSFDLDTAEDWRYYEQHIATVKG